MTIIKISVANNKIFLLMEVVFTIILQHKESIPFSFAYDTIPAIIFYECWIFIFYNCVKKPSERSKAVAPLDTDKAKERKIEQVR